jgi:hypothetical protein
MHGKKQKMLSPRELARRLYRLTPDDIERFDGLYCTGRRGRSFRSSFVEPARLWHESVRRGFKTDTQCRRKCLESIVHPPFRPGVSMEEIASLARYMCWRIETEVWHLRAKEAAESS